MLRFRFLGIPVGVHVTFLFIAVLGLGEFRGLEIAYWTAAAFVAILLHEYGHALTARAFGAVGISITLFALGGVTQYRHGRQMSHGRSFLVSAAGSGVGILAGGVVIILYRLGVLDSVPRLIDVFLTSFVWAAMVWGILNWIPIVPLDGGSMVLHLASMVNEEKAPLIGQIVTWITVVIVVPIAVYNDYLIAAFLVVMFAFTGLRDYRRAAAPPPDPAPPSADPVDRATESPNDESPEHQEPPAFPI